MLLQTTLGASYVLAHPGGDRLHLLNASAADLWQLYQRSDELDEARPLVQKLIKDQGLATEVAKAYVEDLLLHWRQTGLVAARFELPATGLTPVCDWVKTPPYLEIPQDLNTAQAMILTVKLAGLCCGVWIEDDQLAKALAVLLSSVRITGAERLAHHLVLTGTASHWQMSVNEVFEASGQGLEDALTGVLHVLINLACQAEERLLVIHGAGLRLNNNQGLLLIAPGGSGKTTLATALNAQGYELLSDDVVPVTLTGKLLGLGTPICLKSGSWSVLADLRPDIAEAPMFKRFNQTVRYVPPLRLNQGEDRDKNIDIDKNIDRDRDRDSMPPLPLGLLLFPRYEANSAPHCIALCPEEALRLIIEAEAVLRNLTQAKLDALATWISSVPAYAITYPDLDSALALVQQHLEAKL